MPGDDGEGTAQVGALGRVEPGGGLVEHQDPRVAEQGLGERDPPALAAGEPGDPLGGQVAEPDEVEHAAYLVCRRVRSFHSLRTATYSTKPKAVMSQG